MFCICTFLIGFFVPLIFAACRPAEESTQNKERAFLFYASESWKAGEYNLRIEGRLEDLAGNNLNRPFDKDLKTKGKSKPNESRVLSSQGLKPVVIKHVLVLGFSPDDSKLKSYS